MRGESIKNEKGVRSLRYGLLLPFSLMMASIVTGVIAYSDAKQVITDDLNNAMITLANRNRELWTRQDTIAAIRKMHDATHKPLIYQASDLSFSNLALKDEVYFTLALIDKRSSAPKIEGDKITSDSIMLLPQHPADGVAVRVQGFAHCSMASVFVASDQTLSGVLFSLALLSMLAMLVWRRRKGIPQSEAVISLDGLHLTPMQRRFAQMLLDAPDYKVEKATLCAALWGNKSNAEESLYTLVKRTKTALADTGIEIVCNRGYSYELRVNRCGSRLSEFVR